MEQKNKKTTDQATIDLFAETQSPLPDWINELLSSSVYQQQKIRGSRVRLRDEQLQTLLHDLTKSGGQLPPKVIAESLNLPQIRLAGFLAGAQKLLNVDGYPVLTVDRDSRLVKLNGDLLKKQFDLTE